MRRILLLVIVFYCISVDAVAKDKGFDASTKKALTEKLFPFLNSLTSSAVSFEKSAGFMAISSKQTKRFNSISAQCNAIACLADQMKFSKTEVSAISGMLVSAYGQSAGLQKIVMQLRKSHVYANYEQLPDTAYLRNIWLTEAKSLNHIFDVYIKGKKPLYPKIDSISFKAGDKVYQAALFNSLKSIENKYATKKQAFFNLPLIFSIRVLELNGRDESVRYEPLTAGWNKDPYKNVKKINWDNYKYSMILVPGFGPEESGVKLSLKGAQRCDSAAVKYKQGLAPYLIVSGGHAHPFKTPFCEAVEMKKYLMERYNIPSKAIFIEPYARHTTTNVRNINKMVYQFGIPDAKPILTVTDAAQNKLFLNMEKRSIKELGYVPFKDVVKLNERENQFYPVPLVLHINAIDPLDP